MNLIDYPAQLFNERFHTRMPQQAFPTLVFMEKKTNIYYLYAQQIRLIPNSSLKKSQSSSRM